MRYEFCRLSKLAGIQLTKGNSDITDLSDSNRPTKLSEKWSSLYTDEWSDAFDDLSEIKKTNDNYNIEKELCDIVKASLVSLFHTNTRTFDGPKSI